MYLAVLNASISFDTHHWTIEVAHLRKHTKLFSLQVVILTVQESLGTRLVSLCLLDSSNCVMGIHWYSNKERICTSVLHFEPVIGVVHFSLCETLTLWQKLQEKASNLFFRWGTPPRLCLPW